MTFQFEHELELVSEKYFVDNGFKFLKQVPLYNRIIDLVAIDSDGLLLSVEFKLRNWKRALEQALANSNSFDFSYVCVPGGRYMENLIENAKESGIGVMVYDDEVGTIKIVFKAERKTNKWRPNEIYLRNYLNKGIKN